MNRALQYIEQVSVADEEYGETLETVTVSEAIIACKLQELAMLTELDEDGSIGSTTAWGIRKTQLEKELRNIKIK